MTQQYSAVKGMDFTLASPPLTDPPLSLLDEARTIVDLENLVAQRQMAAEKLASAQLKLESYDRSGVVGDDDQPGEGDTEEDAAKALRQQVSEWSDTLESLDTAIKEQQRWEHGFVYLPELSNDESMSVFAEDSDPAISNPTVTALKPVGPDQDLFGWYDPFLVVALDSRSLFGWPFTDYASRAQRAARGLKAHRSWQAEYEFWTGAQVPTNYHLSASPSSPLSSPHRTITAWPNPTAAPSTTLGTAASLSDSLAALDQAIANGDGGTGMIHATPYVVQKWAQVYPYLKDPQGFVRTVNNNVIVPGYGYPGTGPDTAGRSVSDAVFNSTTEVTSATAAFTTNDLGRVVTGAGVPRGTVIASVVSATEVLLSAATTTTGSGETITIAGQGGNASFGSQQWAYATDFVFHLQGDVMTYPYDLREMSPDVPVDNLAEVRAEQSVALITNKLVRAAVLVDTTTI